MESNSSGVIKITQQALDLLLSLKDIEQALNSVLFIQRYLRNERIKLQGESPLHKYQTAILDANELEDVKKLSLRKLGYLIGLEHPQQVKYHKNVLIQRGLI